MNEKFKAFYDFMISLDYKDVTDKIDLKKGKRRIKKKSCTYGSVIVFYYQNVYYTHPRKHQKDITETVLKINQ